MWENVWNEIELGAAVSIQEAASKHPAWIQASENIESKDSRDFVSAKRQTGLF